MGKLGGASCPQQKLLPLSCHLCGSCHCSDFLKRNIAQVGCVFPHGSLCYLVRVKFLDDIHRRNYHVQEPSQTDFWISSVQTFPQIFSALGSHHRDLPNHPESYLWSRQECLHYFGGCLAYHAGELALA